MNFPPLFRSLHSSLFIAFHYLPSPFITFHRRPISLSAHSLLSRFVLPSPRFVLTLPRFVLTLPRFVLTLPRSLMPPHSPASHLLPSCFITPLCFTHPSFTHHCLRPFVLLPFFYSLHCFTPLCFTLSHCLHPLRFIYSHCFAPVFLLPDNLRKPVPDTAKGNVFLIFQRNFAKSP